MLSCWKDYKNIPAIYLSYGVIHGNYDERLTSAEEYVMSKFVRVKFSPPMYRIASGENEVLVPSPFPAPVGEPDDAVEGSD